MIYFDNSATTKPFQAVIESYVKVSSQYFGNPSSLHRLGLQAEQLLMQARAQMAELLKVTSKEIYFTSGGTEGNNLAIKGAANMHQRRGKHLITTSVEHPSVKNPMEQLKDQGFEITYLPVDKEGRVNIDDLRREIRPDTILVSIMHVNNEIGTIQPIEEIGEFLSVFNHILFHVDAVQGVGKIPLDIKKAKIDLCTISGHKFHGLKGTGVLYVRHGVRLSPLHSGGGQESHLRSGTENVAGIVSMAKALRLAISNGQSNRKEMQLLNELLRKELNKIEGITIHSPQQLCVPHILNFSIEGFKAEVFVHALEEKDIYVSTMSACSSKKKNTSTTLLAMGVSKELAQSAIRISLSYENTIDEAKKAVAAVKELVIQLRKVLN
ncbi:cysteine desulfurase family protein [Bacillus sp. 03113]|uniref:cysteine desulfurase family protein n=1 Tax=Bacillus sp. 03113 TaxID=2578211 RepID=UPI001144ADB2|nr:cysteine desulfurase family protein [Bacillus sp. 03113]